MKVFPSLVILALSAAAVNAQVTTTAPAPRTPPAAPSPAPAPEPARAPRAVIISPDWDYNFNGIRAIDMDRIREEVERARFDTERLRFDSERMRFDTQRMAEEARGLARIDMDRIREEALRAPRIDTERIRDEALRAAERVRVLDLTQLEQLTNLSTNLATTITGNVAANIAPVYVPGFSNNLSYAPVPNARWGWSSEQDPADSVYNAAREAMNRGEYRRSADLFAAMRSRFPRSTKIQTAAYYEAYMRYKIGSTEELRSALRLLTENRNTGNSEASNEMSILTTRVRGALAQRGDEQARRDLAQDAQKGGCDREDMQIRAEALSAVASSDPAAATPMLRRVLEKKDPCTLDLRRRALSIMLRRQDTSATNAAISVAKNADETLELRVDAVQYLSRVPSDNALTALEDLMRSSQEREVQRAAVRALMNSENSRARSTVRAIIERNDASEELRREALMSFSKDRGTSEEATYLRNLYPRMQSEAMKRSVMEAVGRIGGTENDQFLLTIARNANEPSELRSTAISRLARNTSIPVADFSRIYDAAESRSIRVQVVNALGQRKEPEALDKMIDILKNGTDSSVRNQIISILSRHPDPKAKAALADFAGR